MQHAIGDHALLADSRTAALIDPDGNVAWCCWPRVDSEPLFMSILDPDRGGSFTLRPAAAGARVEERRYDESPLILTSVWRANEQSIGVVDALMLGSTPALVREVRTRAAPAEMEVVVRPRDAHGSQARMHALGDVLVLELAPARVRVTAPGPWRLDDDGARCRFQAVPEAARHVVMAGALAAAVDPVTALAATRDEWSRALRPVHALGLRAEPERALGAAGCHRLLDVSAAVLLGLRNVAGGIVAAPTASLPQWPGSARCWDYRYCWLRDGSLAAQALLRLGLTDAAAGIGDFIGKVVAESGVRPVVRVDGTDAPPERTAPDLRGYRGARPVRFGNAAADQLQADVAGEVLALAGDLGAAEALPESLAAAAHGLAGWIESNWRTTDHGIWEIRGRPRRYTHSAVMAWAGLDSAMRLAESGRIPGRGSWLQAADAIRGDVLTSAGSALRLHIDGGAADAALSAAVDTGFLDPGSAVATATLDLIGTELADEGVLQRYAGTQDLLDDPCAPFIFPTFWLASAETRAGRDGSRWLRAAASAAGPFGLFGEVRDPGSGGPLGNYPQVQSHAALVMALVAPH
ncbi:MAG: glycoside hydrolase family 15 protein [Candidatus Dormibacteraeota bacterium]|nr:glycoside hydrolase family 15 protein [Candidatus Dormibacteraeota bacterium]